MEPSCSSPQLSRDMAPLQGHSAFRITHCMNEGQITPPSSPSLPQLPHGPRLQLSSLFRRSRSIRIKTGTTASTGAAGLSDRHRTTTAIRPSVVEMKAPFPFLLPESPTIAEGSPSVQLSSPGLRRMTASYHDLRAVAQRHASSSSPLTPLLPSPISREPDQEGKSYFNFQNPRSHHDSLMDTESLDSEQILSYYCDADCGASKEHEDGHRRDSFTSDVTQIDDVDEQQSDASVSRPVTPSGREYCDTMCSDESGWLANTTSHEERMRRFKTRFYQVVQHPWTDALKDSGEDQVMIATVLVGPGKPKLVQIQRPPSSQASQEIEVGRSMCNSLIEDDGASPSRRVEPRPFTPVQAAVEVSAFSPYDTPGAAETPNQHLSIDSYLSTTAYAGSQVEEDCKDTSHLSQSLIPTPLSLPSRSRSSGSDSSVFSSTAQHLRDLADPFGTPSSQPTTPSATSKRLGRSHSGSSFPYERQSSSPSWPIDNFLNPNPRSWSRTLLKAKIYQQPSPSLRPATVTHLRKLHKLSRVLSAVTEAIDRFPGTLLELSTPVILELRNPHVPGQEYVDALSQVFPGAKDTVLESLSAWVLVDLFLERLKAEESGRVLSLQGFSPARSWRRPKEQPCSDDYVGDPKAFFHADIFPPEAHAQTDAPSPRIPSKARTVLGIGSPDVTSLHHTEQALRKRAESVAVSVGVVGQRLVEALRGSEGWDLDLWRAVRLIVQIINDRTLAMTESGKGRRG